MIFFAALLFIPLIWFLPWWSIAPVALVLGFWMAPKVSQQISVALAAAFVWPTLAFLRDGQNYGLISKRMSGLLSLPHESLIFPALAVLAFTFALLWVRSGALLKESLRL